MIYHDTFFPHCVIGLQMEICVIGSNDISLTNFANARIRDESLQQTSIEDFRVKFSQGARWLLAFEWTPGLQGFNA